MKIDFLFANDGDSYQRLSGVQDNSVELLEEGYYLILAVAEAGKKRKVTEGTFEHHCVDICI